MMHACHTYLQKICNGLIDAFYYSPYHPMVPQSLSRKPGTLLFEKAMAKFNVAPHQSWMLGDKARDIIPANQLGIKTIQLLDSNTHTSMAQYTAKNIKEAASMIVKNSVL